MLVDAMEHPRSTGVTDSTVLGPFYVTNAPQLPSGADISGGMHEEAGQPAASALFKSMLY
jgi:hydroxyquinol 1,2-dioxygenase